MPAPEAPLQQLTAAELFALPCVAAAALVGARVAAECDGGARHEGLLHALDPHTHALVLLEGTVSARGDSLHATAVRVVLAHALQRLSVLRPASACEVPEFQRLHLCAASEAAAPAPPFDAAQAERRRSAVVATLAKHHVPCEVTRGGGLLVLGCLTLDWPFTPDAASCPNARVLERVAALLAASTEEESGAALAAGAASDS